MKHRQSHYRATAGFVTLAGLLLGLVLADQHEPATALAGDDKVFAPHYCVPLVGETDQKNFHAEFGRESFWEGGRFICPLVRDIITGELDAVWVRVINRVGEGNPTECCVHSVSPLGSDRDSECQAADDNKGQQSIAFTLDSLEEYDNGHYVVTCDMHGGDLYSIRTSESN